MPYYFAHGLLHRHLNASITIYILPLMPRQVPPKPEAGDTSWPGRIISGNIDFSYAITKT